MPIERAEAGADNPGRQAGEGTVLRSSHEETHSRFFEDLSASKGLDFYQARPEYKNGLASEKLMEIEQWFNDTKNCGKVDQGELADKLIDFAKNTGELWKKMEESLNDGTDTFLKMSQDQFMTYSRFGDLLFSLDDKHREAVREHLPGALVPGE